MTMTNIDTSLISCPFCGGKMVQVTTLREGYEDYKKDPDAYSYHFTCVSCAAESGWAKSLAGAIRLAIMREGNLRQNNVLPKTKEVISMPSFHFDFVVSGIDNEAARLILENIKNTVELIDHDRRVVVGGGAVMGGGYTIESEEQETE